MGRRRLEGVGSNFPNTFVEISPQEEGIYLNSYQCGRCYITLTVSNFMIGCSQTKYIQKTGWLIQSYKDLEWIDG